MFISRGRSIGRYWNVGMPGFSDLRRVLAGCVLLFGLLAAAGMARSAYAQATADSPQESDSLRVLATLENAMVQAVERAERSVVAVARVQRPKPGEITSLEPRPDPFGLFGAGPAGASSDDTLVVGDYAAGVVIDASGLIVTVYHFLGQDCDYYVTTSDHRIFKAAVKAADPRSDLAVLAVEASDLTPIRLGAAERLRKGQFVFALGNPYAIAKDGQVSASWGIVSNLHRKAPLSPSESEPTGKPTIHHFGTLIQTDAKLSFNTSGGALVNLSGEMVGLLTDLPLAPGYEKAAGYAYPVDATFRRALERLKRGEEVEYGFLGLQPDALPLAERLQGAQGTRVDRVVPGTPADRAGLRPLDVITAVDGNPVYDEDGLVLAVGSRPADGRVRLDVIRGERSFQVEVALTKYPVRGKKIITAPPRKWRGMVVEYVSAMGPERDGGMWFFPPTLEAVAVKEVDEGSPAWKAGLRPGDLVSHVAGTPVGNPREFFDALADKNGPVVLRLVPNDTQTEPISRTVGPE
ncbi:MAG: DegQ family serine endoprotease [Thermogutta sp.]